MVGGRESLAEIKFVELQLRSPARRPSVNKGGLGNPRRAAADFPACKSRVPRSNHERAMRASPDGGRRERQNQ